MPRHTDGGYCQLLSYVSAAAAKSPRDERDAPETQLLEAQGRERLGREISCASALKCRVGCWRVLRVKGSDRGRTSACSACRAWRTSTSDPRRACCMRMRALVRPRALSQRDMTCAVHSVSIRVFHHASLTMMDELTDIGP